MEWKSCLFEFIISLGLFSETFFSCFVLYRTFNDSFTDVIIIYYSFSLLCINLFSESKFFIEFFVHFFMGFWEIIRKENFWWWSILQHLFMMLWVDLQFSEVDCLCEWFIEQRKLRFLDFSILVSKYFSRSVFEATSY